MLKAEKIKKAAQLLESLKGSQTVFAVEFKEINVPDITLLRQDLKDLQARYVVVKNRVIKKVADQTILNQLTPFLTGPTALVICWDDPVGPAKKLLDFMKDHPAVKFKGGCLEGKVVEAKQLEALAKMPTRDELLAKFLYLLHSPIQRLVRVLNAPLSQCVGVLDAIANKKS